MFLNTAAKNNGDWETINVIGDREYQGENPLVEYKAISRILDIYKQHLAPIMCKKDLMQRLPTEMCWEVLKELDPKALFRCSCVSRTWRALAEDEALAKAMFAKCFSCYRGDNFEEVRPIFEKECNKSWVTLLRCLSKKKIELIELYAFLEQYPGCAKGAKEEVINLVEGPQRDLREAIIEVEKIKVLNLSNKKLQRVPTGLGYLRNLQSLYLDCNQLKELSENIKGLSVDVIFEPQNSDEK